MSDSLEDLARISDSALYTSKTEGRDRATIGEVLAPGQQAPRQETEDIPGVDLRLLANSD